jgi:hypothetical protein
VPDAELLTVCMVRRPTAQGLVTVPSDRLMQLGGLLCGLVMVESARMPSPVGDAFRQYLGPASRE